MNQKYFRLLSAYTVAAGIVFSSAVGSAQTVLIGTNVNDGSFESITAKSDFTSPTDGQNNIPYWGATLVNFLGAPVDPPSDSGAQIGGNVVEQGAAGAFWQPGSNSTAFNLVTNYTIAAGDQFVLTWNASGGTASQTVTIFSQSPSNSVDPWSYVPVATLAVANGNTNPTYFLTGSFAGYTLTYTATATDARNFIGITAGNSGAANYIEADNFTLTVLPASGSAPVLGNLTESPATASSALLAGTNVSLSVACAGTQPISFQWQTDGGSGGALTNIPGATGTNIIAVTAGWMPGIYNYDLIASNAYGVRASIEATIHITNVLMVDIGSNAPVPGPYDISQLTYVPANQNDDGFNYYTDNGAGHNEWNGQTFTTGNASTGYVLETLAWLSAGNGNSFGNAQLYDLFIYEINSGGATAQQIGYYQMYGGGIENDWFEFTGLNTPLAPNTQYAYALGRDQSGGGWEHIADQGGNLYAGGQICQIESNGVAVTYGPTGASDTTFDVGLSLAQNAFAPTPAYSPDVNPVYAGTELTLNETGVGAPPLTYQWLADGGTGTLSPVSGATGSSLAVNTTGFTAGNYEYEVIVSNSHGASTSGVLTVSIVAGSAPVIVTDITPAPGNEGYVGEDLSYSASFTGTLPITYQWYLDTGAGPQPISSSSNPSSVSNTLVLNDIQISEAGSYSVTAKNSAGSTSSSSSTLTVLPAPSAPASNTYGAAALSAGPVAYWRFNEDEDPSTGVLPAYDATGHGFDGVYGQYSQNGFDGIVGPRPPAFPGFESTNFALGTENALTNSWVTIPALNLNTNTVTITMWIYPTANAPQNGGLLFNRPFGAGLGFGGTLNAAGMPELGYTWNTNSSLTWGFNSGLYPLVSQWSFVALVIQPSSATLYLYYIDPNTGQVDSYSAINAIPHGPAPFNTTSTIGTDAQNLTSRAFSGSIDEVAIYDQALSSVELQSQFALATGLATLNIVEVTRGSLVVSWTQTNQVLLESTNVGGPWITNSTATSPYAVSATNSQMFFKVVNR